MTDFYLDDRALVRERLGEPPEVYTAAGWQPHPDFKWFKARLIDPGEVTARISVIDARAAQNG